MSGIRARTIRPDGSVVNFDGKIYEKSLVRNRSIKFLAKTFTLPEVQPGSIIEYFYSYDFEERLIFNSHWVVSQELFTRKAKFSLRPYRPMSVRWVSLSLPSGTAPATQGHDGVIRLEAANIPAFQTEAYMPPEDELKSRVDFVYSYAPSEKDMDKFWREVGKELNHQLEDFVGKRRAMEQAVAQIVSPTDPPELKLQKIYARVQQLRNLTFEVEKTEQEEKRDKEKDAKNVEDIWKRGSGHGWQLTWLYLGLVRAAGFEASGVWVSDRLRYIFAPQSMDPSRLDENVVLVKLNGKDLYLDPGAAFTPFGLLPWSETGVHGLRLDKEGGTWITTTLPESSASRIERTAKLKLSDAGDLEGKLTVTFIGLEAARRRLEERHDDDADRKKFLEEEVKDYIPISSEVDLANKPEWGSSSAPLSAEFNLKVSGWVVGAGRRTFLPVGLFAAGEKHLFDHANRVHPIYFEFPSQKVDDVSIELPLGWQAGGLPAPLSDDGHIISYSLKAEDNKGTLHLSRKLSIDIFFLQTQYYPALRNFFQQVRTGDEQQIVLQPIVAAK